MTTSEPDSIALVIGAGSGIAQALIKRLAEQEGRRVIAFSRDVAGLWQHEHVTYHDNDYSVAAVEQAVAGLQQYTGHIGRVFLCNGILHGDGFMPEKTLRHFDPAVFQQVINANTLTPVLWLSRLLPVLKGGQQCKVTAFSARIGSITDNRLGGWYSYRASKAALNMLLKTSAIELARTHKNIKLLAFHPGTTDTPLSKPFQSGLPEGQLLTAEYVAQHLCELLDNLEVDGTLSYLDWESQPIEW
jgi:NAD(P)-dependent dehydrogenase (short-subunit alcohol dehydrogenase family)